MVWFVLFRPFPHTGRKGINTKVNSFLVLFALVFPCPLVCRCICRSHRTHHLINMMARFPVPSPLWFLLLLLPMSFLPVLLFRRVFVTFPSWVLYSLYSYIFPPYCIRLLARILVIGLWDSMDLHPS